MTLNTVPNPHLLGVAEEKTTYSCFLTQRISNRGAPLVIPVNQGSPSEGAVRTGAPHHAGTADKVLDPALLPPRSAILGKLQTSPCLSFLISQIGVMAGLPLHKAVAGSKCDQSQSSAWRSQAYFPKHIDTASGSRVETQDP